MKKFLLIAAMGALFFIGLTAMTNSNAEPYPYCQEDCEFLVGVGLFATHGACMSACHTCTNPGQGANSAVCYCKLLKAGGVLDDAGVNFGQCVNIIKGGG